MLHGLAVRRCSGKGDGRTVRNGLAALYRLAIALGSKVTTTAVVHRVGDRVCCAGEGHLHGQRIRISRNILRLKFLDDKNLGVALGAVLNNIVGVRRIKRLAVDLPAAHLIAAAVWNGSEGELISDRDALARREGLVKAGVVTCSQLTVFACVVLDCTCVLHTDEHAALHGNVVLFEQLRRLFITRVNRKRHIVSAAERLIAPAVRLVQSTGHLHSI